MKSTRTRIAVIVAVSFAVLGGCTKHKDTETHNTDAADVGQPTLDPPQRQTPSLTSTSATIGPKGGTLSSSDNRLSLSIPAGAFASDTQVSIQPMQGSEEGLGAAYRLTPEGVTFPQPVTLAWHLSEDDLAQTNLDNLNVASQAANGGWTIQEETQRDEATHTVSARVSHFSTWRIAQTLHIVPAESRVYAGDKNLWLQAVLEGKYIGWQQSGPKTQAKSGSGDELNPPATDELNPPGKDTDLLTPPPSLDPNLERTWDDEHAIKNNVIWRVNGLEGGSPSVGTIYPRRSDLFNQYSAPDAVPSPNRIVTVSIEVTVGTHKMIASALVEILPRTDHWVGSSHITQFDGTTVISNFTFAPVRSFERRGRQVGRQRFEILDGMVYYKGPKTTGSGCPLNIKPTYHRLQAKEGSLYIDAQDPKVYLVNGGGQAVWPATYISSCPNGTQYLQSPVSAAWWPTDPTQMSAGMPNMIPVTITYGRAPSVLIQVDTPFGKGTVTLRNHNPPLQQPVPAR